MTGAAPDRLAEVRAALATVIDPETGHDLVAMGMIYAVELEGDLLRVTMTTTIRGCPMAELLRAGAEAALAGLPGIARAEVRLTWDPPWTPARIGAGIGL
ncbi:metal-sulfur cluster assembly factor [Paracoccus siganidrum]|uniref:Metal-sulfur cluster assembly factor n=1 Tax=Paracoccus siganidrum TaxID=1276757 RepID=A0A419A541_9RHOB|nr:metal-sulfur cluster assembly factor [Paracoccus siganidrum]RJL10533.1 metal-sulfur cluster assembly factor [Paracoccus siganidrum]RMC35173.1 aromatic ring hydroxylase [Paracoccus siganidrum]